MILSVFTNYNFFVIDYNPLYCSCGTNDTSPDISEQPCLVSDTEVLPVFSSSKAIKRKIIALEETDKSFSDEMDSDGNFRSAFEMEKETNLEVRDAVMERIVEDATLKLDVASCTSTNEQPMVEVPYDTSVGIEDSGLSDAQKNVNVCITGNATSVERPSSSCCTLSSIITEDVKES